VDGTGEEAPRAEGEDEEIVSLERGEEDGTADDGVGFELIAEETVRE
jgi:hypothetical protein